MKDLKQIDVNCHSDQPFEAAVSAAILNYRNQEDYWHEVTPECRFHFELLSSVYLPYLDQIKYSFCVARLA